MCVRNKQSAFVSVKQGGFQVSQWCSLDEPILTDAVETYACHGEEARWAFLVSYQNPVAKGAGNLEPGGERIQMVGVWGG